MKIENDDLDYFKDKGFWRTMWPYLTAAVVALIACETFFYFGGL